MPGEKRKKLETDYNAAKAITDPGQRILALEAANKEIGDLSPTRKSQYAEINAGFIGSVIGAIIGWLASPFVLIAVSMAPILQIGVAIAMICGFGKIGEKIAVAPCLRRQKAIKALVERKQEISAEIRKTIFAEKDNLLTSPYLAEILQKYPEMKSAFDRAARKKAAPSNIKNAPEAKIVQGP